MQRHALSLIEICMAIMIGSIIMLGITHFMTTSLKSSTKGSSHLTNVQTTAILMAQIETDIRRSNFIIHPPLNIEDKSLRLETWEALDSGGLATLAVLFEQVPNGIKRSLDHGSGPTDEHVFCRELLVKSHFRQVNFPGNKIGVWVKLITSAPPKNTEEFTLERLVFCQDHASNSPILGWQ